MIPKKNSENATPYILIVDDDQMLSQNNFIDNKDEIFKLIGASSHLLKDLSDHFPYQQKAS
jgi:hypothetical protein